MMRLLLSSLSLIAGFHTSAPAAPPPTTTITDLAFVAPLTGERRYRWDKINSVGPSGRSRLPASVTAAAAAAARASPVAMGAKRATDNDAGVSSSSFAAADGQTSPGRGGDADDGADAAARIGRRRGRDRGGGKLPKKALKPLQTRLNDMRLDFSLAGREPYVAGAPPRIAGQQSVSPPTAAAAGSGALPVRQAAYSSYRRRRRPLNALCMPKNQRPQGCAPLLPPMGIQTPQVLVVQHVAAELERIDDLSEFKSDLPCVTTGTCPVPAFRCANGHTWESNGYPVCFYCPICADTRVMKRFRQRRDLEVMQEIARAKGGECIADEYLGIKGKIGFRCGDGHEWVTSPANLVYKNTWCPKCAALRSVQRKKLTIADMHQTARQFGGVFLSPEYHGAAVKHEWRCKRGHTFWNTPNNVRRAEGGRRVATFCKICTMMDRSLLKAAVVGGMSKDDAKSKLEELTAVGAMPMRRHFLKRRATGKSTLSAKIRKMKRLNKRSIRSSNIIGSSSSSSSTDSDQGDSSSRSTPAR